jgi:enamine deaminase RidA (YjgF/YER057c/UK114 family)
MTATVNSSEWYSLERGNCREYWMSAAVDDTRPEDLLKSTVEFLQTHAAQTISARLFGSKTEVNRAASFLKSANGEVTCPPLLILQGSPDTPMPLRIQIHAVSGANTKPVYFEDSVIGWTYEDAGTNYYMLNILSEAPQESKYTQTKGVFEKANRILNTLGLNFSNTIRTWLYAEDILSWYDELNRARNDFFNEHSIYDKIVPASTGIGAENSFGQSLAIQLLAVSPKNDDILIRPANSPLQSSAMDYKSSFSRGIRVLAPDHHRLSISGSASINKAGKTVFIDDTPAQVDLTMRVVQGILNEAGMDWSDTVSSLIYFKHRKDFSLLDDYCRDHGISLPHIKLHADVCRDDLLFEVHPGLYQTEKNSLQPAHQPFSEFFLSVAEKSDRDLTVAIFSR